MSKSGNLDANGGKAKIFWDVVKNRFLSAVTGRLNQGFVEQCSKGGVCFSREELDDGL